MIDGIRNARLWINVNQGWVKITIPYKGSVRHYEGVETDEGFRSSGTIWYHEGLTVSREHGHTERDCDGLHTWGGTDVCSLVELAVLTLEGDWHTDEDMTDVTLPRWQGRDDFCRDHTAEAAGY